MRTKVMTTEEMKSLLSEIFYNKQSTVTKLSDESVINALFFGQSRAGQKAVKDISLVESIIFPQFATGSKLESSALLFSSLERNAASKGSTFLKIIAQSGTTYSQSTVTFTSTSGVEFELTENFTVGDDGYGYAKVRSKDTGSKANVEANTITKVSPQPGGHIAVTNEFKVTGGRDAESDEDLRQRIYEHPNIASQKTLAHIAEVFKEFESDVLFLQNQNFNSDGKLQIAVVTQNGIDLTSGELETLLDNAQGKFALTDINKIGNNLGIELVNPTWYEVGGSTGVDFRVELYDNYDGDQVRKNIQIEMSRYFDIRYWTDDKKVEWDDLLQIVKENEGIKYVPDDFFNPSEDEEVPENELPRIKKFIMRDLSGNIISDNNNVLSPVFYPNE
jgi:hypothetical protein